MKRSRFGHHAGETDDAREDRAMIGALSAAAALLLVGSGLAKLAAPRPAGRTIAVLLPRLRRSRLPVALAYGVGVGEVAAATAVLALGGRLPVALLAGCYFAFAVVAVRLRTAGDGVPCGCFGRSDAPVSNAHIVLDVIATAACAGAAANPVGAVGGLLEHSALIAVVGIGQVALLAWLGYLAITALPALTALSREA
jgi:hypothetical protein